MSSLDRHVDKPDRGIISTDLFIYDAKDPGTGGVVSIVVPHELPEGETQFVKTAQLQISFTLDRAANTAEVTLAQPGNPPSEDRMVFQMTADFYTKPKVSLTVLFSKWKIVAMIDGEPLRKVGKF